MLFELHVVAFLIAHGMVPRNRTSAEANVRNPNLALMKTATQSSTFKDWGPHLAVDGSTTAYLEKGFCSTTKPVGDWHWWMVDLDNKHTIRSVAATIIGNQLDDFRIEVSSEDPITLVEFPGPTNASLCVKYQRLSLKYEFNDVLTQVLACDEPVTGRYVRVMTKNNHDKMFVLCELEVYSQKVKQYTVPQRSKNNLAYMKMTAQSSSYGQNSFSKAVDGDLNGRYKNNSCTQTNGMPTPHWWLVDLGVSYTIESVRLVNRLDCCQDRLQNFTIQVSTKDPTTSPNFPEKIDAVMCHNQTDIIAYLTPVTFVCDASVTGRYVIVVKSGRPLTLCEVEVFGKQENAEKQWRLDYVTSHALDQQAFASVPKKAAICAEIYERKVNEVKKYPFIQVDTKTGECRFINSVAKALANSTSPWILYKYLN